MKKIEDNNTVVFVWIQLRPISTRSNGL
ncbi:unnamed protein product [Gulo gulo]|uniref:Uncharacterized protein n=1 Tax=Gulo gulo TaxID=48420 RepID=A0A9X9Q8D0_GULGU|nr:unnamed protein product [Gulo gulo]